MNSKDEKEGSLTVEKITALLTELGKTVNPETISDFLEKEKKLSGAKTEEDYQEEQAEWLKMVKDRKK